MCRGTTVDSDPVRQILASPLVRAAIERSEEKDFATEACVRRFLRYFDGDTQVAAKHLAETLEWRRKTKPRDIVCPGCQRDPHSHALRVVGIDNFERPVILTDFSQAMHRFDPDIAIQHLTRSIEDAIAIQTSRQRRGGASQSSETTVWMIDFHGYSPLWDSNPRVALLAARMVQHYPEQLGCFVILDAPKLFQATWRAVKQIINAATADKVTFVRTSDGTLEKELDSWANGSLKNWILTELADNRKPGHQKGEKEYWKAPSEKTSPSGEPVHDPRGSPEFVSSLEFKLTLTSRLVPAGSSFSEDHSKDPARCRSNHSPRGAEAKRTENLENEEEENPGDSSDHEDRTQILGRPCHDLVILTDSEAISM